MLDLGTVFNNPWTIIAPPASCYNETIVLFARNIFILLLAVLLVVGIVMIALSALRVITSQGNADQSTEGFTGIKNVLLGIALLFGVLFVLVIIASIFLNDPTLLNCPPEVSIKP